MIVEMRTYTIQIGKMGQFLEYYATQGLPVQERILGNLLGYFTSDVGELNQALQFWGYENYGDRESRRAKLAQDPEWLNYLKTSPPVILKQENRILLPAAFSPIK